MAAANQGNGAHMGTTETRALRDARARWRKRDARAERALGRLLLWLALGLMAACATELTPGAYRCEPGLPGQCPAGWGCQVRAGTDEGRCYPDGATCGDGILGSGEECDGLALSEEAACPAGGLPFCTSACRLACTTCGNGVLEATPAGPREECDDGNLLGGDGCSASCLLPRCGDGVLDLELFEECDDGAGNSNSRPGACRLSCRRARCGDGVVDAPRETCDDSNLLGGDGCNATCNSTERCGNGFIDTPFGETCDDANFLNHDGCSSSCKKEELGWSAIPVSPGHRPALGPITHQAAVYDAARQLMVVYGGGHLTEYFGLQVYDETYEWGGRRYRLRNAGPLCEILCPLQRRPMVYDANRRQAFRVEPDGIFGWNGRVWLPEYIVKVDPLELASVFAIAYDSRRKINILTAPSGTWEWDSVTHSVRRVGLHAPPDGNLIYEPRVGKMLTLGARVWEWSPQIADWVDVYRGSMNSEALMAAYDVHRGYVVVANWSHTATWDHQRLRWTSYVESPCPYYGYAHGGVLAYHGEYKGVMMMGSECGSFKMWNGVSWGNVEAFDYPGRDELIVEDHTRAGYWSFLLGRSAPVRFHGRQAYSWPASPQVPPALPSSAAVDEWRRQVVLWLGGSAEKETWVWDAQGWSRRAGADATPNVLLGSLHYDSMRKRVLLVARQTGEVWSWDGTGWSQLVTPGPVTLDFRVVYDRRRQRLMRVGNTASHLEVQELDGGWNRRDPVVNPGALQGEPWYDIARQRVLATTAGGTWEWTGESWRLVTIASLAPAGTYRHATGLISSTAADFGYQTIAGVSEVCESGIDVDRDSLVGCADPDCWPYCTPGCMPGETCALDLPRCGDGTCDEFTESCRLCPGDCGACTAECGDVLCDPGETAATCPGDCP